MTVKNIIRLMLGICMISLATSLILPLQVQAQESVNQESVEKFSREELAQMLAPIALYPDVVLTQVLMASTYPIEVIEADRWVKRNPEMKGNTLDDALVDKDWDPSVKALCHFPKVLALMSERISETTNIGNAFLAQEDEVMGMIQELRAKAKAEGNLNTTEKQKIVIEKETIIIEPADPDVIYVPYYDPLSIYGPWWYPAYPPYYWGPSRVSIGVGLSYWPAYYFGFAFGSWSYFDWPRHSIYIDVHRRPRYVRYDRWRKEPGRWHHRPAHRKGVAYRDKFTARKYGQAHHRAREFRPETRGFPERRDLNRYQRLDDRNRFNRDTGSLGKRRTERDRSERTVISPNISEQQNNIRDRQNQTSIRPERLEQRNIERSRMKQRTLRQPPAPATLEPAPQPQSQPVPTVPRMRTRIDRQSQIRERAEREQQMRSRENIFNRVEEGRRERDSSMRGQYSRQRWNRNDSSRDRSQNENYYDRGRSRSNSRDDRSRSRR